MFFVGLFLVTFAAYSFAEPQESLSAHKCDGRTFCDNPQKKVDEFTQNKHRPHRMRRSPTDEEYSGDEPPTLNCVKETKETHPYKANNSSLPFDVYQQFLALKFKETYCKFEGASCLASFDDAGGVRRICSTKTQHTELLVRTKSNKIVKARVKVRIDCACEAEV